MLLTYLADDPRDSFSLFAIANEYAGQGRREEALRYFDELVTIDPNYVGAYYHLAKLLEDMGDKSRAIETYRKGIEIADLLHDSHSKAELQSALMEAEGVY